MDKNKYLLLKERSLVDYILLEDLEADPVVGEDLVKRIKEIRQSLQFA